MTAELEDQGIAQGEGERIAGIYQKTLNKRALALVALAAGIILLTAVAVTLGSAGLTVSEVYLAILSRFFPGSVEVDQLHATIIWDLRLHRVIFAVLAGFGLAIAGAMMQGVLRNPLASPFTLGIASAASFGAALAIMFIPTYLKGDLVIVICAFLASLLAAAAIYGLSRYRGMSAESMVLAGIILMYFFGAVTSFLQYTGSTEQLQAVVFWMFGSLQRTSWLKCGIVAVVLGACVPYVILRAWDFNVLAMGDQVAQSLGVRVDRARTVHMFIASLITASIICFTGTIGFIGLVAPHITRLALGGDHRYLLVASGMIGALILLLADSLARTILAPAIIPVGIMTSFIGIPFFLYLFLRRKEEYW
ncbi:MAG TPA: iron ABC transporter permease [Methanoregulaceae archaeon]|nr:MAG: iron ABC transporter permease [Methanolinea sp.]HON82229.1 iron ABC transporter permease [Methanoregulaceae archaeon]HPD10998.1 iron ABC transporter permease [Methanoregulaceae archaeon]HRT15209.1 iron ABC transporter permease [Methanoregulaceae archaeon]HRU30674.1 iron ABC transporter permease [Methanoregulaceae archaeon]